jgi:integrase
MKLDARTIPQLQLPEGKTDHIHWDGELAGYGYRLRRSGDKVRGTFIAQYRHAGATRRFLIGSADLISAAQAREQAKKVLAKVQLGVDPQQEKEDSRRKAVPHSLGAVVEDYLALRKSELRPNTFDGVKRYLTGPYFRPLHSIDISTVARRDVATALNFIVRSHGKVAAARARATLSAFYTWAMQQGRVEANPVVGTASPEEPPPRDRVLDDRELAAVWCACADDEFGKIVRLLILTGCRRQEIGGMLWSEIDFDKGTWTLPAARAKNGRGHTLPLLDTVLGIIRSVPRQLGRDHLFGTLSRHGFTSWYLFDELAERAGFSNWTVHDIRRSVATGMADIRIAPHVIEAVLNHQSGHKAGIAGIYNRSSYAREVQAALAQWESHIAGLISGERKVIPFDRAGGNSI